MPSLREYAARYQINGRRLAPRQLLMHPGPVNRGVELSGEVDRLAPGGDHRPGRGRRRRAHGGALRAARRRRHARRRRAASSPAPTSPSRHERRAARARARPAAGDCSLRGAHVLDPRAGLDGRARRAASATAQIAEIAAPGTLDAPDGAEVVDGSGRHLLPGLRRPARAPAHARPGAQGGHRHRHARRRRRRLLRGRSRCPTPTRSSTAPRCCARCASAAAREARIPVGFLAAITRGLQRRGAHRDGRAARGGRASASPTTAGPSRSAGMLRKALQYQRLCGGVLALHEEDPTLSRRRRRCTRARSSRALGLAGIPSISRVDDGRARRRARRLRGRRASTSSTSARRVGRGRRARQGARACRSPARSRRTTCCSPTRPSAALDTRMKMNPPLRTEADRQALIEGLRDGDDRLHRHRPRAARARGEGGARSSRRRWARPGWRPRSPPLHTELVLPGRARPGAARRAHDRRRRAVRAARAARSRPARAANLVLVDLDAEWDGGRGRLREPLGELLLRRAHAARPRAADASPPARSPTASAPSRVGTAASTWAPRAARPRPRGAGRGRRAGGVPAAVRDFDGGRRARAATLLAGRAHPRRAGAGHRAVPEGARAHGRPRSALEGERAAREDRVLGRARPTASTSTGATRRSSAGSRRTSASSRPSHDLLDRRRRGPRRRRRRRARATRTNRELGLHKMERAGRDRRRASRRRCSSCCERAGTPEFKAVQKLIR